MIHKAIDFTTILIKLALGIFCHQKECSHFFVVYGVKIIKMINNNESDNENIYITLNLSKQYQSAELQHKQNNKKVKLLKQTETKQFSKKKTEEKDNLK